MDYGFTSTLESVQTEDIMSESLMCSITLDCTVFQQMIAIINSYHIINVIKKIQIVLMEIQIKQIIADINIAIHFLAERISFIKLIINIDYFRFY